MSVWFWVGFSLFVLMALSFDTFFLNKNPTRIRTLRVSLFWTITWILCAFVFNGLLWAYYYIEFNRLIANQKAIEFLTGYVIEKTLSIDNLFVFYMIFQQLRIPTLYQYRVFSYGIWSAVVLRLVMILFGTWLIVKFHWILYIFGIFLLLTGLRMFFAHEGTRLTDSKIFLWIKHHLRLTQSITGRYFFIRQAGLLYATPLLLALILIEISDLVFALDSISAIFAITHDPFIIWSSNIFAILGLRALYFLLSSLVDRFYLLKYAIALLLIFVGLKILIAPWVTLSALLSLGIICAILAGFVLISFFVNPPRHQS